MSSNPFVQVVTVATPGPQGPPGEGGGISFSNYIDSTLATGTTDWGLDPPTGYDADTTDCIYITASGVPVLSGLLAPTTNNFLFLLVNLSSVPIDFLHQSASLAANQFNCPNGNTQALPPNGTVILIWINGYGWFFS